MAPTDSAPSDSTGAAFFDVDNTIMRGASIFQMARGMYQRDFITSRDVARFTWQQVHFSLRGENLNQIGDIQTRALSFVAGHRVSDLRQMGEEIYDELMADRIWPGPHALAKLHLDAGQQVWLVTATPVEVADVIASRLGLTGAIATIAESEDGVYTGQLSGPLMHGEAKAEAIRALAEREGLDLDRCTAYSDSINDLPMLTLVGTAVAINPDARLRAYARAQGWQIHDYRTGLRAVRIGAPLAAAAAGAAGLAYGAGRLRSTRTSKPSAWKKKR